MNKRLISGLLSAVMAINVITILPANAFALGTESKVYEKDGYTVTYQIGSEWDGNRSVEVSIKNTGEESILNWALKYDVGGEVYNLWNSKVYDSSEEYTIIKNNGYNYEIEPGQSANYGYIVKGEETVIPEDIELCSRRIDVKSGYEIDFNVTSDWYTGFNGEISITNVSDEPIEAWTLSFDSNFDINNIWNAKLLTSENRSYEAANQLWTTPIKAGESASFGFSAEKSATENANAENFVLTAVVVGRSALEYPDFDDIDYELDSDSDGLPDYYEDILGTDKNNPDTDGDGLTDGYEVFYLGTDPLKADSDDNGVNDGDEDPDNDGLSNLKECELGTDPNNSDTDGDGLTDGAEVNIHKTDSLKYDTDEDGISDGDEIALGLDPNSGSTNGIPDSERTFTQTVSADSEALSAINEYEDTPFKVSLEMKAAGVAENNVYARESGYSNAIENSAILGAAPEFVYTDGLAVEEVTVKFELNDSAVNNTLGTYAAENDGYKGIKRLNVFMFFEDVNMLLPIETQYDEENNIVSATTDRVGTYCLMDMEMFFQNLGIKPSKSADVEGSGVMSGNLIDNEGYLCYNVKASGARSNEFDNKDNFDVAFIVGEVCYDQSQLEGIRNEIQAICTKIFARSKDVTISVYGLDGAGKTHSTWYGRANNLDTVETMLGRIEAKEIQNDNDMVVVSECIDYVTFAHKNTESEEMRNRSEYCFMFFDPAYINSNGDTVFKYLAKSSRTDEYGMKILEAINQNGTDIDFSTVTSSYQTIEEQRLSYTKLLSYKTDGVNIDDISFENVVQKSIEHIYGETYSPTYKYSMGVLSTNWKEVKLKAPITYKYYELNLRDNLTIDEIELYDCADTDDDGVYDFQEIMFKYNGRDTIIFESTDDDAEIVKLYSLADLSNGKSIYKMPVYVENALLGMEEYGSEYYEFINTPLIFIYSDPTSGDGDGDGISDPEDIMPLITLNYKSTRFSEFVDTAEFFEIKFIFECRLMKGFTADDCVDCIEILRKYKGTDDIENFQQEMISAGLVSPDAASSATWFDKISWSAWAENGSAPLLNEYENYANDTSFEELFEKSWYEWSDTCKTAFAFWAFGAAEKYVDYMQNWHKISCVPEDYNVHFNINDNSGNHKNLSNYSPKEISGMKRNELKRLLPNGWDFQEHNGRIHIRDEKGNFRIRIDPPNPKTNYTHIHIYDANNNCLDIDGNIVSNKSPSGHIPYNN